MYCTQLICQDKDLGFRVYACLVVISLSPVTTVLCSVKSTLNRVRRAAKEREKLSMPLYFAMGSWNLKSPAYFSFCSSCKPTN